MFGQLPEIITMHYVASFLRISIHLIEKNALIRIGWLAKEEFSGTVLYRPYKRLRHKQKNKPSSSSDFAGGAVRTVDRGK